QVRRGARTENRPCITRADQVWEVAAVIDVRVREDDGVQAAGIKGEAAVADKRLFPRALVQPAVEQYTPAVDLQKVLRSRDCLGGAVKVDFHSCALFMASRISCPNWLNRQGTSFNTPSSSCKLCGLRSAIAVIKSRGRITSDLTPSRSAVCLRHWRRASSRSRYCSLGRCVRGG